MSLTNSFPSVIIISSSSISIICGVPRGVWGVQPPLPPEIPKFWHSCIWLQIERKMFSVPIPAS